MNRPTTPTRLRNTRTCGASGRRAVHSTPRNIAAPTAATSASTSQSDRCNEGLPGCPRAGRQISRRAPRAMMRSLAVPSRRPADEADPERTPARAPHRSRCSPRPRACSCSACCVTASSPPTDRGDPHPIVALPAAVFAIGLWRGWRMRIGIIAFALLWSAVSIWAAVVLTRFDGDADDRPEPGPGGDARLTAGCLPIVVPARSASSRPRSSLVTGQPQPPAPQGGRGPRRRSSPCSSCRARPSALHLSVDRRAAALRDRGA